mgnify:CR=1 FL=1
MACTGATGSGRSVDLRREGGRGFLQRMRLHFATPRSQALGACASWHGAHAHGRHAHAMHTHANSDNPTQLGEHIAGYACGRARIFRSRTNAPCWCSPSLYFQRKLKQKKVFVSLPMAPMRARAGKASDPPTRGDPVRLRCILASQLRSQVANLCRLWQ